MCASQSKTAKLFVTRRCPFVPLMMLLLCGDRASRIFSAPGRGCSSRSLRPGVRRLPRDDVASVGLDRGELARLGRRRSPRERSLDGRGERLGLAPLALGVAFLELGHDAGREQLERGADVLVPVVAALLDEDRLVDAGLLELTQRRA